MKTVTPEQLCQAYQALNPGEITDPVDGARIMGNWLQRYNDQPAQAVATCNWAGKVTTALFHALGIKQPRTKREMLAALSGTEFTHNRVWGCAAGRRTTADAARGAFTTRDYTGPVPTEDWLEIITVHAI